MSNPLYEVFGGMGKKQPDIVEQFLQFKQAFTGDPRQQVQQLLNSGKVSQEQYNDAVAKAKQLQSLLQR